jgi:hypothetical protein
MIKIKLYEVSAYHKERVRNLIPHCDIQYCVYLFGILIHSVLIEGIDRDNLSVMFKNKKIESLHDKK